MSIFIQFPFNWMEFEQKLKRNWMEIEQKLNGNWGRTMKAQFRVPGPYMRLYASRKPLTDLSLSVLNFHSIFVEFPFKFYSIFIRFLFNFFPIFVQFLLNFHWNFIQLNCNWMEIEQDWKTRWVSSFNGLQKSLRKTRF